MPQLIGIVNAILVSIGTLSGINDPQYKITPVGFLQMLLENSITTQVSNIDDLRKGFDRTIKVRYMQRSLDSDVVDTDDCDTNVTAVWQNTDIGAPVFNKIGIGINDSLMRQLEVAATQQITLSSLMDIDKSGNPSVYLALYQTILTQLNGLIQKIDKNLLAAQSVNWGVNAITGSAAAVTLNFANTPAMQDGITKLIYDAQLNEIAGTPLVVGNGVITQYDILQSLKKGFDTGGFGANPVNVYADVNSVSAWGANHFGLFVPGLTSLVDYNKNVGAFAGVKGGSIFFTIPMPVQLANGKLTKLVFDAQLKYNDCPTQDEPRGWVIQISKYYVVSGFKNFVTL